MVISGTSDDAVQRGRVRGGYNLRATTTFFPLRLSTNDNAAFGTKEIKANPFLHVFTLLSLSLSFFADFFSKLSLLFLHHMSRFPSCMETTRRLKHRPSVLIGFLFNTWGNRACTGDSNDA